MYRRLCFRRAIVVVTGWMEVVEETKDVVEGIGRDSGEDGHHGAHSFIST